jgi:hypothetical protein
MDNRNAPSFAGRKAHSAQILIGNGFYERVTNPDGTPHGYFLPSARFSATTLRRSFQGAWNSPPPATDALGVHVHFFRPGDGAPLVTERDLDLIQLAGFRKVRMDILWSEVEKQPGVFDFRRYDWAVHGLLRRGIQPMIILGLGNPLYAQGLTLGPDNRLQPAFERYALETVKHYRGQGLIYELVNEPNLSEFWQPQPDVNAYMRVARHLLPALKAADPTARLAAPSTAGAPPDFLEACFRQGLLSLVDGVTIHPYQAFHKTFPTNRNPETFEAEYRQTRALIDRHAPPGKRIPILLGEWGYSSATGEVDERTQANYLVRQALLGMMYGTPADIWYDWKGDINGGGYRDTKEDRFGLVTPALEPGPGWYAMRELSRNLSGKRFLGRLPSAPGDYLLAFGDGVHITLAGWTSGLSHWVTLPSGKLPLTGTPIYING